MTPQEKAVETRRRHKAAWDKKIHDYRERQVKIKTALTRVISSPDATPSEILEAVKLLKQFGTY